MTRKKVQLFLFLFISGVFVAPFITSCSNKGGAASNVGLNTQLQILNLSPDLGPVNLYIGFLLQGTTQYTYPFASGYFYLNSIDTPLQIRLALRNTSNLLTLNVHFHSNHKYSLFITGYYNNNTDTSIFTYDDTAATPMVGFGKIRFVNASLPSTNLTILANGTIAFDTIKYLQVSKYVQLPAGNYNFQMYPTGTPTAILSTPALPTSTQIQDGRLYTLYSYGIVGRTDTSAFGAGILANR